MTDTTFHTSPDRQRSHLSGYNLVVIVLMAALLGLALAYLIEAIAQRPQVEPASIFQPPFIEKNIAGSPLRLPADWFSDQNQTTQGFADRVELDLAVNFGRAAPDHVTLLLTPNSAAQPSAYLLDKVYLHQFLANQLSGAPGLVGKPLRAIDGFQNETVWYDPLSPQPFVAKCQASPVAGTPAHCMRTVRLTDGLSATYNFPETLLADWPRFDEIMRPYLEQIGAIEAF